MKQSVSENTGETWSIGAVAEHFGLTNRTLRYYEDEGMITPIRKKTTRLYTKKDRGRIALICRGKRLGFSLEDIKEFLSLYDHDKAQVKQMNFLYDLAEKKIQSLQQQKKDLLLTLKELHSIQSDIRDYLHQKDP